MQETAVITSALLALAGCAPEAPTDVPTEESNDPRVETILREVSTLLGGSQRFSFAADVTFEELEFEQSDDFPENAEPADDPEVVVTVSEHVGRGEFTLSRPGQLRVSYGDDLERREFFLNGDTATMAAPNERVYAVLPTPGTIDAALDILWEKAGVAPPVSDLLYADPYARLAPLVVSSSYEGIVDLDGTACHHILVTQAAMDWQLWVEAGDLPVPRKMEVTYREELLAPVYTAELGEWNFSPAVADETFTFVPPDGAVKVDSLVTTIASDSTGEER